MFSFTRANHIIDCGGKVTNSSITNSSIDMNNQVITNHSNPINSLDVANKYYVDTYSIPFTIITLTGTGYTTALPNQSGVFDILIKNVVIDGPTARFSICKSEDSRESGIYRLNGTPGYLTEEKLEIRWLPNNGVELRKTGINYDGSYLIKYIQSI